VRVENGSQTKEKENTKKKKKRGATTCVPVAGSESSVGLRASTVSASIRVRRVPVARVDESQTVKGMPERLKEQIDERRVKLRDDELEINARRKVHKGKIIREQSHQPDRTDRRYKTYSHEYTKQQYCRRQMFPVRF